jgi:hypothetical protein
MVNNIISEFEEEINTLNELGYTEFEFRGQLVWRKRVQLKDFFINGIPFRKVWPKLKRNLFDLGYPIERYLEVIKQKAILDYKIAQGKKIITFEKTLGGIPILQGKILPAGKTHRNCGPFSSDHLIFDCPWCGRVHNHGAPGEEESPVHLVSHCRNFNGFYWVEFERGK